MYCSFSVLVEQKMNAIMWHETRFLGFKYTHDALAAGYYSVLLRPRCPFEGAASWQGLGKRESKKKGEEERGRERGEKEMEWV